MNRSRRATIVVRAGIALLAAGPAPLFAQGVTEPPTSHSLFSTNTQTPPRHHLDLFVVTSEAFDTSLPATYGAIQRSDTQQAGGYSTTFTSTGSYERLRRSTQVRASGTSDVRYFTSAHETQVASAGAAAGLTSEPWRHGEVEVSQTFAYAPSYLYRLLDPSAADAGALPVTASDYKVDESRSYAYVTTATVSQDSVAGGKVVFTGDVNTVNFEHVDVAQRPDVSVDELEGKYVRSLTRNVQLSAGYDQRNGEFGYGGWTVDRGVPVAFTYSRPLSGTRRAEFHVNATPERIDIPVTSRNAATTGTLFRVSADAFAAYPFLRTWHVSLKGDRRLEYIGGLATPAFSTGARFVLSGFVSRRTFLTLTSAYADAKSVLETTGYHFATYTGAAQVRYALTRTIGVYGGYLFYDYVPRPGSVPIVGYPAAFTRHGVRLGVMLFVPGMER